MLDKLLGIDKLLKDSLETLPRSDAWKVIGTTEGLPKDLRTAIKEHATLSKRLENLKKRSRKPRVLVNSGPCRGCGTEKALHRDRAVKRRCLFVMKLKYFVARDWDRNWSDPAKRQARMAPAWKARRARKDKELLDAIHPHVRSTIGDEELLRRLGRRPEQDRSRASSRT